MMLMLTTETMPNHALQRTGTASLRVAVNRPLSLVSLGVSSGGV